MIYQQDMFWFKTMLFSGVIFLCGVLFSLNHLFTLKKAKD